MTKEQIQALIDAKIAGQGSAIDIGGALPAILGGILELASGASKPVEIIEYPSNSIGTFTKEELCARLGIAPEVLDEIMSGRKNMLLVTKNGRTLKNYIALLIEQTDEEQTVVLGGVDTEDYSTLIFSTFIRYDKDLQKYDVQDI